MRGEPAPTLLSLLDACGTPAGSRLLRHWLTHPLRAQGAAAARHAAIAAWVDDRAARLAVAQELARTADVERIAARIALASARPRDLAGLRDTLARLPAIAGALAAHRGTAARVAGADARASTRSGPRCSREPSRPSRRRRFATAA